MFDPSALLAALLALALALHPSPQAPTATEPSTQPEVEATAPESSAPSTQPQPPTLGDMIEEAATLFGPTFERTSIYGWITLLGGIFFGLLAGRIAQSVLTAICTRLEKRGWMARAALFKHAAGPANLALIAAGLALGLTRVHLTDSLAQVCWRVIALLYIIAIAWFAYNVVEMVDIVLRRVVMRTRTALDDTIVSLVRRALRVFLLVMMGLFAAENIFGADITAWLAGLGIAGLAVSLAAQDPIKNIFGSFTLLVERPFVVGDRVIFSGIDGTIEQIGLRSTRVRTLAGHLVTVPNMKFTDSTIENITRRPSVRRMLNVTITYDTPPEKVLQAVSIIKSIFEETEVKAGLNLPDQPPRVIFNEFNADSLNLFVIYWYPINRPGEDWWTYQAHAQQINLRILRAFNEAGIEFAFPTRTLYLASDPKRELNVALSGGPASAAS